MIRSELSSAYVAAGAPQPPSDEWSDWIGKVLAAARAVAGDGDPAAAADLLGGLREELALPVDPEPLLVEARMRLRSGRPGAARQLLSMVLAETPGHLGALRLRSRVVASQGDLRGAVADAQQVLAKKPDLDLVQSTLIRQQLMGDWAGAHALLDQQRAQLPELDATVRAAQAELDDDATPAELVAHAIKPWYRRLGDDTPVDRWEEALPLLAHDVEEEPSSARAVERLAAAQFAVGRVEEAAAGYARLVDLEPLEEESWYGLARTELRRGRVMEAMSAADRALAVNPDSHRARMVRVEAAAASPDAVAQVTRIDDRRRLVLETKDAAITAELAPMLDADGDHRDAAAMRAMAGLAPDAGPVDAPAGRIEGLVVYTVVTGGYEQPSDPRDVLGADADVVVFTDDPSQLPASMQPIARRLEFDGPSQLASRHPKMLPHLYFPDHERSIYVDANFHLRSDPRPLAEGLTEDRPMTVLRHSERTSPLAEARLVVERGFARWTDIHAHFARQRAAGFDPAISTLSYGGFLARLHHRPDLIEAMNHWWAAFEHGVRRDQLSLDFALWSAGVRPTRLPLHNHRNDHWIRIPHA